MENINNTIITSFDTNLNQLLFSPQYAGFLLVNNGKGNHMSLSCILDNVIYKKKPQPPQSDTIILTQRLQMSTEWAEVVKTGPESVLTSGDEILISCRPASFTFEIDGEIYHNIEDKAVLGYKRNGELNCTCGTILYSWVNDVKEEFSAGGILLRAKPKETTAWAKVHAAGPKSGLLKDDLILIKYEDSTYPLEIDGVKMANIGMESVICYKRGV